MNNENNPQVVSINLGSLTTDNTQVPAIYIPKKSKFLGAWIMDRSGISASDSNYIELTLKYGTTSLATLDSRSAHEGALTANTAKAMTVVEDDIPAESNLILDYQETGTVAMTDAQLVIEFYPL
jgi:hypothetical protein